MPSPNLDLDRFASRTEVLPAATKIVATLGPACEDRFGEMIDAGMSVGRLNFSHGNEVDHRRRVAKLREAAAKRRVAIGILADIQGPKMRMGKLDPATGGSRQLVAGEEVRLEESEASVGDVIPVNIAGFLAGVAPGHRILLADAAAELVTTTVECGFVHARVRRAGLIGGKKGAHLPDSQL